MSALSLSLLCLFFVFLVLLVLVGVACRSSGVFIANNVDHPISFHQLAPTLTRSEIGSLTRTLIKAIVSRFVVELSDQNGSFKMKDKQGLELV